MSEHVDGIAADSVAGLGETQRRARLPQQFCIRPNLRNGVSSSRQGTVWGGGSTTATRGPTAQCNRQSRRLVLSISKAEAIDQHSGRGTRGAFDPGGKVRDVPLRTVTWQSSASGRDAIGIETEVMMKSSALGLRACLITRTIVAVGRQPAARASAGSNRPRARCMACPPRMPLRVPG